MGSYPPYRTQPYLSVVAGDEFLGTGSDPVHLGANRDRYRQRIELGDGAGWVVPTGSRRRQQGLAHVQGQPPQDADLRHVRAELRTLVAKGQGVVVAGRIRESRVLGEVQIA